METTGARVLIVDDDAHSRRLLAVRLRALECVVVMAADGREAPAALQQDVPVLMLLDLHMPGMSGLELLRTVRRGRWPRPRGITQRPPWPSGIHKTHLLKLIKALRID